MKKIILIIMFFLIIPAGLALTLRDYPDFFVDDNKLIVTIVIGDMALASDTIGAVEISTSLNSEFFQRSEINAVLASEVENIKNQNLIIVGGPCANSVAAEIMDYPSDCSSVITPNTGLIKLYDYGKYKSILIAGDSAIDTRRASAVLANYVDYNIPESDSMEIINKQEKKVLVN